MGGDFARTQRGVIMTGRCRTRSRITSKAAEPGPTMMPARISVTGTGCERSRSPVSRRERRCSEVGAVGHEAAEVDDALHAGGGAGLREMVRGLEVEAAEVGPADIEWTR